MRSGTASTEQLDGVHSVPHGHVSGQLFRVINDDMSFASTTAPPINLYSYLYISIFCFKRFSGSCKSCPKRLTTCSMGARQCTECKSPEECSPSHSPSDESSPTRPLRPAHRRLRQKRPIKTTAGNSTIATHHRVVS